jgi:hypothetical protein
MTRPPCGGFSTQGGDEIGVFRLDQAELVARLDDALDLAGLMAGEDQEEIRGRANDLLHVWGELQCLRAFVATALAEEFTRAVWVRDLGDPFVYLAQEKLVANELFGRNGHRVLPSRGDCFGGTR